MLPSCILNLQLPPPPAAAEAFAGAECMRIVGTFYATIITFTITITITITVTITITIMIIRHHLFYFFSHRNHHQLLPHPRRSGIAPARDVACQASARRTDTEKNCGGAILHSIAIMNALLMKPSRLADPIVHDQVQMHVNGPGIAIIIGAVFTPGITIANVLRCQPS